jgi:phosphonopyruvate decarboxylase
VVNRVKGYLKGIEDTKLEAHNFPDKLSERGTDFFAGVSDSLLKDACACISDTAPGGSGHVPTANEGTAVAAATGHHVATGKTSMVRCLPRVKVLYLP